MNDALSISLEPLKLGQMFDRAFRIYRAHFGKLVGIAAIAQIISFIFQGGIGVFSILTLGQSLDGAIEEDPFALFTGEFGLVILLGFVGFLVLIVVSLLTQAALAKGVSQAMFGEEFTVSSAYQDILPSLGKLVVLTLALIGLGIAIVVWLIIPCVGWLTGLGMLFFFSFVGAFAVPILVLEHRSPIDCISRAWFLARRRFWWVVGFAILLALLTGVLTGGLTSLATFGGQAIVASNPSTGALVTTQLVQVGVASIVTAIVAPFSMIAYLLFYFDLRVRTEGFDLTLKSKMETGASASEIVAITPSDAQESFVTREDMLNFFLLTIAAIGLYILFIVVFVGIFSLFGSQVEGVFESVSMLP